MNDGSRITEHGSPGHASLTILDHVLRIVREAAETSAAPSRVEISPQTSIRDQLRFDSLDYVELVMEVEDWFDIAISDEDAERWRTPADIAAYVAQRLAKREEQEQE